ncbi:hypothetical protein R1X32_07800 (plasmid) [Rhodococcus opacus]
MPTTNDKPAVHCGGEDRGHRAGNRVVVAAGAFAGHATMSIGMLVHELSVLVAIVNPMRLFVGGVSAPHITRRPRRARGSEPGFPIRRSNR